MKVATLQYRYSFPKSFDEYQNKITHIVKTHAEQGVQLLLFPEYAGLEWPNILFDDYYSLFQEMSHQHKIWICSGTQYVKEGEKTFNRSFLFSPHHTAHYQDKCILTPYEVKEGILSAGKELKVFETELGKIGICICYDVEFPIFAHLLNQAGAECILVPSYTSSVHGFYRVFLSSRARSIENQCFVIQSVIVGQADGEMTYGSSMISTPVDIGFPEDGILAIGKRDEEGSVIADLSFRKLQTIRNKGETRNFSDGQKIGKVELHHVKL